MSSASVPSLMPKQLSTWGVLALWSILVAAAAYGDEGFLINFNDPFWDHIAAFKWWLLPHGIGGALALFIGPFQFSENLRRSRPALHRLLGRVYIGSIIIASILSIYITIQFEPPEFQVQIWAQGGGWFLTALLAYIFAVKRNFVLHRQWVARSYGFTFIFIAARVPDAFAFHWPSRGAFVEFVWMLIFAALIVPDMILQWPDLRRKGRR